MRHTFRLLMFSGLLCAALLGGLLATIFAPDAVQAAPVQAFAPQVKLTTDRVDGIALTEDITIPDDGVTRVPKEIFWVNPTSGNVSGVYPFTVQNTASLVEVTYQGRLVVGKFPTGASHVYFELRVDDTSPITNTGLFHISNIEANTNVRATFSGYWQNLAAGQHEVSLWVWAFGPQANALSDGSATTNVMGMSDNAIIIKEYLPFGATFLPSVMGE